MTRYAYAITYLMDNEQFIFAEMNLLPISRYNLIFPEIHQYPMRHAIIRKCHYTSSSVTKTR